MKTNWQRKKLGEVCGVIAGQSPEGQFYNTIEKGMPFYQGKKEFTEKFIGQPTTWTTKITKEAFVGDILMSVRAPVGPVNFATEKICIGRGLAAIRASKEIDKDFLFNFLKMFESEIVGNAGAVFNSISKTQIENIEIPLPPLAEQERIVKILNEVFEGAEKARANAEKNLKNSQELFESYLQKVFANPSKDWEEKKLGEVCDFTQGIQVGAKLQSETRTENQIRFLRIIDFTQGNELPRYINNPGKKYIIEMNDVSLVRYGASTGFVCRGLAGVLANNLFRVIPKNKKEIENDYLFIFLKSPAFQNIIKESMNGAAMPAISFGLIKDIPIPMMPVPEQKAIVKKLDALLVETKKLEAIYRQKLVNLDELKKSVLKQAFSGKM